MTIDRWAAAPTLALWFRAVERIDVPAGGSVPSQLAVENLPLATLPPLDPAEAADGWRHLWERALEGSVVEPADVDAWPGLHEVVAARWREAARWHSDRKRAALTDPAETRLLEVEVVQGLESDIGRTAPPFALDLWVLPLQEPEVRGIGDDRWIVAESVYLGPTWPDRLRGLLRPHWG